MIGAAIHIEFVLEGLQLRLRFRQRLNLVLRQHQVKLPIFGVKAPVTGAVFDGPVCVAHELGRSVYVVALKAHDARVHGRVVQLRPHRPSALPETVVHYPNLLALVMGLEVFLGRRARIVGVEEGVGEALGVRFGDEPAGVGGGGQDAAVLQVFELPRGAARAVNLKLAADGVDLRQGEVAQDRVQDLREAQPRLAADHEAGDGVAVQEGLGAPVGGQHPRVGRGQHGQRLRGERGGGQEHLGLHPLEVPVRRRLRGAFVLAPALQDDRSPRVRPIRGGPPAVLEETLVRGGRVLLLGGAVGVPALGRGGGLLGVLLVVELLLVVAVVEGGGGRLLGQALRAPLQHGGVLGPGALEAVHRLALVNVQHPFQVRAIIWGRHGERGRGSARGGGALGGHRSIRFTSLWLFPLATGGETNVAGNIHV